MRRGGSWEHVLKKKCPKKKVSFSGFPSSDAIYIKDQFGKVKRTRACTLCFTTLFKLMISKVANLNDPNRFSQLIHIKLKDA